MCYYVSCCLFKKKNKFKMAYKSVNDCSICLEKMKQKNKIKFLKCGHVFHATCIKKWNNITKTCPICRAKIL